MRRFRNIERHVWAALPIAAVAAGWIGIWMLWPDGPANGNRRLRQMRVAINPAAAGGAAYRRPVLFGRPSPFGFRPTQRKPTELSVLSHRTPLPPRLLTRGDMATPPARDVSIGNTYNSPEIYQPFFTNAAPFANVEPEQGVYVHAHGGLRERGLTFGAVPAALASHTGAAWEVELTVRIDPDGRVANIMLREASAGGDTVRQVEHYVLRATAPAAEREAIGLVRMGCARP